jgi:Glycosyl hydrolases family 38 C-terminal domain
LAFTSDSIYRNASASVRLRYYDESPSSEWEVYLGGLPNDNHGREVTVNWKAYDFKNSGVFYTDSNGLEMQKRVMNYRPTWNFTSFQKVASNYYPVNSAIAIVDESKRLQMTVLNDRSQGGSAVEEGRVELMQNRRLFYDDDRGVDEPLNETDDQAGGQGISVPARYRLIFTELKN